MRHVNLYVLAQDLVRVEVRSRARAQERRLVYFGAVTSYSLAVGHYRMESE